MATWWLLCLIMASASAALESRSCLKVTLPRDSEKLLQDLALAKNGVQHQINIEVVFQPQLNSSLQGPRDKQNSSLQGAQGEQNSTSDFTNSMEFVFGWDKWAWVAGSEGVVLDLDFRYKVYSFGLFSLAEHNISVEVDFDPTKDACGTALRNLTWTEKIRKIAVAIKIKVDMIVDSEENKEEKMMMKMMKMLEDKNETCECDCVSVCGVTKDNSSKAIEKFDKDLNANSLLCFPALRPYNSLNASTSTYLQTEESQSKYTYSFVCYNSKGEEKCFTKPLMERYRFCAAFLLLPFVPLFLLWLWPKSTEVTPSEAEQEFERSTNLLGPLYNHGSKKMVYVRLDDTTPIIIIGLIPKLLTMKIKIRKGKIHDFVAWFRRFFMKIFISTHAIIVMGILDRCFYHEQIETMIRFMKIDGNHLAIVDFAFWDYIFFIDSYFSWNFCSIFCIFVLTFWIIGFAISSHPAMTPTILELLSPSLYFGFEKFPEDVFPEAPKHLEGLNLVLYGMTSTLGLLFNGKFWKFFFKSFKNLLKEKCRSTSTCTSMSFYIFLPFKITFHFLNLLSLFPLFIVFPWDCFAKRVEERASPQEVNTGSNIRCRPMLLRCQSFSNPKKIFENLQKIFGLLLIIPCIYIVCGYQFLITVYIYIQFLLYIVAATVQNYQLTLTLFGVLAGTIAFVLQIRSKVKKKYIDLKMTIVQIATELHAEIVEANDFKNRLPADQHPSASPYQGPQDKWKCIKGAGGKTHVQELIFRSKDGLPCIPKCLYAMILNDRKPVGIERLKVLIQLVVMALFVTYIVMVNQVFRKSEVHEMLHMSESVMTVGAVLLPSIVGGLQSDKATELKMMQNRIKIKWLMCNFLKDHEEFYNYMTDQNQ